MNTADRSLALLDTALRRRFEFEPVMPDARDDSGAPLAGLRVSLEGREINIPSLLAAMNHRIEALYDRDHTIGHAYFMSLMEVGDGIERMTALGELFRTRIVPLLDEYFFADWHKIRLVLADNQTHKKPDAKFVLEEGEMEKDLEGLFSINHGLDAYGTKRRHRLNGDAFLEPNSYTGIYYKS